MASEQPPHCAIFMADGSRIKQVVLHFGSQQNPSASTDTLPQSQQPVTRTIPSSTSPPSRHEVSTNNLSQSQQSLTTAVAPSSSSSRSSSSTFASPLHVHPNYTSSSASSSISTLLVTDREMFCAPPRNAFDSFYVQSCRPTASMSSPSILQTTLPKASKEKDSFTCADPETPTPPPSLQAPVAPSSAPISQVKDNLPAAPEPEKPEETISYWKQKCSEYEAQLKTTARNDQSKMDESVLTPANSPAHTVSATSEDLTKEMLVQQTRDLEAKNIHQKNAKVTYGLLTDDQLRRIGPIKKMQLVDEGKLDQHGKGSATKSLKMLRSGMKETKEDGKRRGPYIKKPLPEVIDTGVFSENRNGNLNLIFEDKEFRCAEIREQVYPDKQVRFSCTKCKAVLRIINYDLNRTKPGDPADVVHFAGHKSCCGKPQQH